MNAAKTTRVLAICATVVASLGLARLADAVGKRALVSTAREVAAELESVDAEYQAVLEERSQLELDQQLLVHRIEAMSKREHYLVIDRRRRRLKLALGDKEMLEVRYLLRGPVEGVVAFGSFPKSTLEVLAVESTTDWYRPDWLYRLEGVEPPADSGQRRVRNAFGPGQVYLGAGIAIHGRVSDDVPAEAIDHTYIQLDDASLKAVVRALQPGALVFIE